MSLAKTTAKNISYLLFARVMFRFLNAIALIYAARYLGNDRYGMYMTATAWANAFLALNDVGMSTLMLRVGAKEPQRMPVFFGNTLLVESVLSLIIWGGLMIVGAMIYDPTTAWLMVILGASNLAYEFRKVMRGVFRSHQNLRPVALTELFNGAVFCIATFAIIFFVRNPDHGLFGIAHASLWTDIITVSVLAVLTLRILKPTIDVRQIWSMIRQALPFTLYNLFYMIYFQIDQIILSIMLGSVAVGIYSAPVQLVTVLLLIPIMVFQVTTPIMYRFQEENPEKYKRIHRIMWRYLSAVGIPAGIGLCILAEPIIAFVFGRDYFHDAEQFRQAVVIMQLFGWFLAIRFVGIAHGNALTTSDRQSLRAKMQAVSVGINIVLDIVLIYLYGPIGAAVATLITEVGIALSTLYLTASQLKESFKEILRGLLPIVAAAFSMSGILLLLKDSLSVIVLVIFGIILYIGFLWIFRFFKAEERHILKEILSRRTA